MAEAFVTFFSLLIYKNKFRHNLDQKKLLSPTDSVPLRLLQNKSMGFMIYILKTSTCVYPGYNRAKSGFNFLGAVSRRLLKST